MNFKDYIKKHKIDLNSEDFEFEMPLLVTEIILASGMTRTAIAKKMGTKQPSLSRAEAGKVEPSWSYVRRLAKVAGVSLNLPSIDRHTSATIIFNINPHDTE